METENFSFYTSFFCLYHLITWHCGFNSGPGPMYFSMDRISLWAEFLHWICAPTPFIRQRFGLVYIYIYRVFAIYLFTEQKNKIDKIGCYAIEIKILMILK